MDYSRPWMQKLKILRIVGNRFSHLLQINETKNLKISNHQKHIRTGHEGKKVQKYDPGICMSVKDYDLERAQSIFFSPLILFYHYKCLRSSFARNKNTLLFAGKTNMKTTPRNLHYSTASVPSCAKSLRGKGVFLSEYNP